MEISLKWINELVNIDIIKLDDLIKKLTLGEFEVEEILEVEINNQKHITLDISATANRSDSLSIQGISTYSIKSENLKRMILKYARIFSPDQDCIIFSSIILQNLFNTTGPKWITQKLISSSITPLNNLDDFQNYILLETGYPFAFYDFDKINSTLNNSKFSLSILKAKNNQEFIAANGNKYKLDKSILFNQIQRIFSIS